MLFELIFYGTAVNARKTGIIQVLLPDNLNRITIKDKYVFYLRKHPFSFFVHLLWNDLLLSRR